jgi:alanine racemase
LVANYQRLSALAASAECAASIKANAYGIGIEFVAPVLCEAGCHTFFVAHAHEGVLLRQYAPEASIFVFHGLGTDAVETFQTYRLQPVLNSLEDVDRAAGYRLFPAIHVDTGMHRLGITPDALDAVVARLEGAECSLFMSHLSSADDPTSVMPERQRDAFQRALQHWPQAIPGSLANTAGVLRDRTFHFQMVRPGIGLYGGSPDPQDPKGFQSVVRWEAPVLQLACVPPGQPIGYGGQFQTTRETQVATLATGYADGYLRCLGDRAAVAIDGVRCPVIGRVSMDLVTIDVTDYVNQGGSVREGRLVEMLGSHISVDELAVAADTIGYELLTRLGDRFESIET